MNNIEVSRVRPSTAVSVAEYPGAVDAHVSVDGVDGEVTLLRDHDGALNMWGPSVDYWASHTLHGLPAETLQAIVAAVADRVAK